MQNRKEALPEAGLSDPAELINDRRVLVIGGGDVAVLKDAKACGAEAVITMCPMCHMNLGARQVDMKTKFDLPIFHSTQLTTQIQSSKVSP